MRLLEPLRSPLALSVTFNSGFKTQKTRKQESHEQKLPTFAAPGSRSLPGADQKAGGFWPQPHLALRGLHMVEFSQNLCIVEHAPSVSWCCVRLCDLF